MTTQGDPHQQLESSIRTTFGSEITVSRNVRQNFIVISDDRALLRAREFESSINSRRDILFPFGLLIGIVTTFVTAEFHSAIGLSKETWSAIFVIAGVLCLLSIGRGIYRMATTSVISPEKFIEQLRGPNALNNERSQSELVPKKLHIWKIWTKNN